MSAHVHYQLPLESDGGRRMPILGMGVHRCLIMATTRLAQRTLAFPAIRCSPLVTAGQQRTCV